MTLNYIRVFLKFSDSEEVESQRKVGERAYIISRFISHRVNSLFLEQNYNALKKIYAANLSNSKAGTSKNDVFF